jgi:hypothetical protein
MTSEDQEHVVDDDPEAGLVAVVPPDLCDGFAAPSGPGPLEVWLARPADDHAAMHDLLELRRGGQSTLLEVAGWAKESPIEAVLAALGFEGTARAPTTCREVHGVDFIAVRGFCVPDDLNASAIEAALHRAMTGQLGGLSGVAHGQAGFHRATRAFEHVWEVAGSPPILVRHPPCVGSVGGDESGPGSALAPQEASPTLRAIRSLEGVLPANSISKPKE